MGDVAAAESAAEVDAYRGLFLVLRPVQSRRFACWPTDEITTTTTTSSKIVDACTEPNMTSSVATGWREEEGTGRERERERESFWIGFR